MISFYKLHDVLAPSDHPNITNAEHIPNSSIRVDWSSVFFSNGEITNYILHFTDMFNHTIPQTLSVQSRNTASYNSSTYGGSSFVHIAVQASNPYGRGPMSPYRRISTIGMFM